jgi:AraC family transcriptional regulator, transcriptional activator of the genes for pyochelin and ferripyochelin receptors
VNDKYSNDGMMMDLHLISPSHGPVEMRTDIPHSMLDLIVPGSEALYAEGSFGKLLFQEIKAEQFTILYNVYRVEDDVSMQYTLNQPAMQTHVVMKGNLRYNVNGTEEIQAKEGQYAIIYAQSVEATIFLEKGNEYRTFNTYYSMDLLQQLFPFFPLLHEQLNRTNNGRGDAVFQHQGWCTIQVLDIINNLLTCPYQEAMRRFYFDNKMKELLFLLLIQKYSSAALQTRLTRGDKAAIHEARNIIEAGIGKHITIGKISQQVGMNEFRLKNAFKQVFGIGMFEYMLQARMQRARLLLLETDKPIKEIAMLAGYTSIQNFQTAFKKYFNATPASLRK